MKVTQEACAQELSLHAQLSALKKIHEEMKELEEVYGMVFLEKSMHSARYRYADLKRQLAQLSKAST